MKEIYIFDIDDCILPAVFPNTFEDSGQSRDEVIKIALEKGKSSRLFPEFLEFYEKNCTEANEILFITGREKGEFEELTEHQLQPLVEIKEFKVVYYPEELNYTADNYFSWKISSIQNIFSNYHAELQKEEVVFKIYDDMPDYFEEVRKITEKLSLQVSFKTIGVPEDWK